jgi:UDP-3-O-acyl-N-acetylglucosamine deacetylase
LIITPPDTYSTPLRLPTEWAAHKLLDLIGDFALLDARPQFRLSAIRPGHRINTRMAGHLLSQLKVH